MITTSCVADPQQQTAGQQRVGRPDGQHGKALPWGQRQAAADCGASWGIPR
jgi:hypothetical protein